ncbi:J domain-containing protein [Rubricoccus marinus]|uniref:J domain-containing protein n=1 Tax=Rubricoccus marinus TaxID=716817 RepID=A0A259TZG7_9BACT|nr:J domain-containing protein [Rubricoccus marinus]OZC02997.1 hypothetical protein BSZ36_08445 [Rubricoccus marinus]
MPESINYSLLAGGLLSIALIASALLGWLGDIKRVGAATSARETTRRAKRSGPRAASGAGPAASAASARRTHATEQEDRIRDAYFAKERKAREFRERQRRQQQSRQKARTSSSGPRTSSGGSTHAAPPSASTLEATYRLTLGLKGPATKESVRVAYRQLIAAYHPDRCATLGVKLQKLAEEETKRINEAYSYFRRVLK